MGKEIIQLGSALSQVESENGTSNFRIEQLQKNQAEQSKTIEELRTVFVNGQVEFIEKMIKRFTTKRGLDKEENFELIKELYNYVKKIRIISVKKKDNR